jgi:hypothetical protein
LKSSIKYDKVVLNARNEYKNRKTDQEDRLFALWNNSNELLKQGIAVNDKGGIINGYLTDRTIFRIFADDLFAKRLKNEILLDIN